MLPRHWQLNTSLSYRDLLLGNHTPLLRTGPPRGLGAKGNLAAILSFYFSFTSTLNINSAHFCLLLIARICSIFSVIVGSFCLFPQLWQCMPTVCPMNCTHPIPNHSLCEVPEKHVFCLNLCTDIAIKILPYIPVWCTRLFLLPVPLSHFPMHPAIAHGPCDF